MDYLMVDKITKFSFFDDFTDKKTYNRETIDFLRHKRDLQAKKLADTQIDESWNAMLVDIPLSRLQMIADLRNKYQTIVLSNTNAIHLEAFNKIVAKTTDGGKIGQFFDKVYYSHELGICKPEPEIYTHILQLNHLKAEETLFIDDIKKNIIAAKSVGLKTVHLTNQDYLTELFS